MHLMADTVSGAGKAYAVLFGHRLNISVVVCVFKARLKGVVVDIRNRKLGSDPLRAHSFKLEICHCARCVLSQRLVDFKPYLRADRHFAGYEVIFYYFLRDCISHFSVFLLVVRICRYEKICKRAFNVKRCQFVCLRRIRAQNCVRYFSVLLNRLFKSARHRQR